MRRIVLLIVLLTFLLVDFSCIKKRNLPQAPSNLSAETTSLTLTLKWQDNSDNEEGFYIQELPQGSSTWQNKVYVSPNSTEFTFTIYQLNPKTSYRVIAYNEFGESKPSNGLYVPTYTTAVAYIYVCPSSASGACGQNYLVIDGNCRQVTSDYFKGGWYNTGFEVSGNNTYAIQFCQGCVNNCGSAKSFQTPQFFLKQKFNTGLMSYCNQSCSPAEEFPED